MICFPAPFSYNYHSRPFLCMSNFNPCINLMTFKPPYTILHIKSSHHNCEVIMNVTRLNINVWNNLPTLYALSLSLTSYPTSPPLFICLPSFIPNHRMPKLSILLVYTKVPRSTKKIVAGVRQNHTKVCLTLTLSHLFITLLHLLYTHTHSHTHTHIYAHIFTY